MSLKFIKYASKHDIIKSDVINWLYIFDTTISGKLPENSFKFGKTNGTIHIRIHQYSRYINISNIECINCSLPDKREALLKCYLKYTKEYVPVHGQEFYSNCREYVKNIMIIIIGLFTDDDILLFESQYYTQNKEYERMFNRITENIPNVDKISLSNINHTVEKRIMLVKDRVVCEFCGKEYSNNSALTLHKNSAKFCLKIQLERNGINENSKQNIIKCTHCNKEFLLKAHLLSHEKSCDQKILYDKVTIVTTELNNKWVEEIRSLKEEHKEQLQTLKEDHKQQLQTLKEDHTYQISYLNDQIKDYKTEYSILKNKYDTLEKQLHQQGKYISSLDESHKSDKEVLKAEIDKRYEIQISNLQSINDSLKKEKEYLQNTIDKLLVSNNMDNKHTINTGDNATNTIINNTYKIDLKELFTALPTFSESVIKERISQIDGRRIIYLNDKNVSLNFAIMFVEAIKDLTFCTDSSRGRLIIKTEDNIEQRMSSEEFVTQCINKSKKECRKRTNSRRPNLTDFIIIYFF